MCARLTMGRTTAKAKKTTDGRGEAVPKNSPVEAHIELVVRRPGAAADIGFSRSSPLPSSPVPPAVNPHGSEQAPYSWKMYAF